MNMTCQYCGSKLIENSAFCNQCGNMTPVRDASSPLPAQGVPPPSPNNVPYQANASAPPVAPFSATQTGSKGGFATALIGGLAGLLAFFAMPFISYSFISLTGVQLASYGYQISQYSGSYQSSSTNGLLLLWLIPIIAGVIAFIAGVALFKSGGIGEKQAVAGWLIGLGVIALVGLLGAYIYLTSQIQGSTSSAFSLTSVLGAGIWVYIIAMVAVIVGGFIQRKAYTL